VGSGQLAALIQGNIPAPLAELVVFKVGVHAGALDIETFHERT
jgi:hypothetical protein